jgi:hypothetical protein
VYKEVSDDDIDAAGEAEVVDDVVDEDVQLSESDEDNDEDSNDDDFAGQPACRKGSRKTKRSEAEDKGVKQKNKFPCRGLAYVSVHLLATDLYHVFTACASVQNDVAGYSAE